MRFICSNGEHSRCHRLLAILQHVHTSRRGDGFDVFRAVDALEDHKGTLVVHWRREPSPAEAGSFADAWEGVGEEPRDNVTHRPTGPLVPYYVWRIHGEAANGSNGGDTEIMAVTTDDMAPPDPHAALRTACPQYGWYRINAIEYVGWAGRGPEPGEAVPWAWDAMTAEGQRWNELIAENAVPDGAPVTIWAFPP